MWKVTFDVTLVFIAPYNLSYTYSNFPFLRYFVRISSWVPYYVFFLSLRLLLCIFDRILQFLSFLLDMKFNLCRYFSAVLNSFTSFSLFMWLVFLGSLFCSFLHIICPIYSNFPCCRHFFRISSLLYFLIQSFFIPLSFLFFLFITIPNIQYCLYFSIIRYLV